MNQSSLRMASYHHMLMLSISNHHSFGHGTSCVKTPCSSFFYPHFLTLKFPRSQISSPTMAVSPNGWLVTHGFRPRRWEWHRSRRPLIRPCRWSPATSAGRWRSRALPWAAWTRNAPRCRDTPPPAASSAMKRPTKFLETVGKMIN